jgi:hypothetical protein
MRLSKFDIFLLASIVVCMAVCLVCSIVIATYYPFWIGLLLVGGMAILFVVVLIVVYRVMITYPPLQRTPEVTQAGGFAV